MRIRLPVLLFYVLSLCAAVMQIPAVRADTMETSAVIINEVRLGGAELTLENGTKVREYITLYNQTDQTVSLDHWRIEYAKSSFDPAYCLADNWSIHASSSIVSVAVLSGTIEPFSVSGPIARQLNDSGSGSLRLSSAADPDSVVVHDVLGWGPDAPCEEGSSSTAPITGSTSNKSLFRFLDCTTDAPIDTNDNSKDFYINTSAPGIFGATYVEPCEETPEDTVSEEILEIPEPPSCNGLMISEILPNPVGTDKYNEYIELFNPTSEPVRLDDCLLKTSGSTRQYRFPAGSEIAAGEYRAFYDDVTGLTLVNAAGGSVLLAGTDEEYTIDYPGGLKSDEAWAYIDGVWQSTLLPTPSAKNMRPPAVLADIDDVEVPAPCPDGKYRNPETNRCRNIQATVSQLVPCKPGQIRSLETNRCRNVATLVSSLVPCRPGQERNPETNRCRNIQSSTTDRKPCEDGYERNPDTNRCRKIVKPKSSAALESLDTSSPSFNSIFIAAGSVGVIGYGAYEYRRDMFNLLQKVKNALRRRMP